MLGAIADPWNQEAIFGGSQVSPNPRSNEREGQNLNFDKKMRGHGRLWCVCVRACVGFDVSAHVFECVYVCVSVRVRTSTVTSHRSVCAYSYVRAVCVSVCVRV